MWQLLTIIMLFGLMFSRRFFEWTQPAGTLDPSSLVATGFIILAAFTMGELFQRMKVPALLGYIAAGIIFGPDLAQLVLGDQAFEIFGATGAIFGDNVIQNLGLISTLTVGVIGTLGGGELKISDLKEHAGTILIVAGVILACVVPLGAATVLAMVKFAPSLVPFLVNESTTMIMVAAVLFGVFGFAMSPTVSLAVIQETRARGSFTSLVLAVVILGDLGLVIGVLLVSNLAALLSTATEGLTSEAVYQLLFSIGAEFGWAVIIGIVTGILFILYLRFVAREMLLFTVGIIFAAASVADMVDAEQLVAFLVAGFIVQNFSKHGHEMIHALEKISLPVFVIYFMTQAAGLDLELAVRFLPLTIILAVVRAACQVGGTSLALHFKKVPEVVERNLPFALLSLGSVDIVLAQIVAEKVPGWGTDLQAVIMGNVIIFIIIGPAVLKWVLGRAGETEEARQTGSEEVAELDRIVGVEDASFEPMVHPEFPDPRLDQRLATVRDELTECYQDSLVERIEEHGGKLQNLLERINQVRHDAIEDLFELLENADEEQVDELTPRVKRLHVQFRQTLQSQIELLHHMDPMPITPELTELLSTRVHGLVDFEETYRVYLEPWLLESEVTDPKWMSVVKFGRRIRNSIGRGSQRTIALGRLWRFYLELSLPGYLASAVAATAEQNEILWQQIGLHLRRVDDLFEQVVRALSGESSPVASPHPQPQNEAIALLERGRVLVPSVDALPMSMAGRDEPEDEEEAAQQDLAAQTSDDPAAPEQAEGEEPAAHPPAESDALPATDPTLPRASAGPVQTALMRARASHKRLSADADALNRRLEVFIATRRERFGYAIEHAYADFMAAVAKAGTITLPAFRYRASLRYDESHRAQLRLRNRLERAAHLVSGYQGWIVLDHQLILFIHWFRTYQQRLLITFQTRFQDGCIRQIGRLQARLAERPEAADALAEGADNGTKEERSAEVDWAGWYRSQLDPALENARISLDQALTDFDQGIITRRLMDVLEARIARFSERIDLLSQNPDDVVTQEGDVKTVSIPLRNWYFSRLLRETALKLLESNERAERTLRRSLVALGEVRLGLETSLVAHQRDYPAPTEPDPQGFQEPVPAERADEIALQGLARAAQQIEELVELIEADEHEMSVWVIEETTRVVRASTLPFLEHRLPDVMHELEKDRGPGLARRRVRPVLNRIKDAYERVSPVIDEIRGDLKDRVSGQAPLALAPGRAGVRARLLADKLIHPSQRTKPETPAIYRRLFSPVPVDIPDFYVERPRLEKECLEAVDRWFHGHATSILISGDSGSGKRTLVHHVLPIRLFSKYHDIAEEQLQIVRLDEEDETERELCEAFFPLLQDAYPRTFHELGQQLGAHGDKRIVFVENADKIYSRTREGLALCERFLAMMERTAGQILWILLINRPAATLLNTSVQLSDYFTDVIHVDPLDSEDIEKIIVSRHKVSGFDISFLEPEFRYLDRLHHPLMTNDAIRNPRREFFDRLGRLSGGNPLLALLYWLESVHLDPADKSRVLVTPLPEQEISLTEHLSIEKKLLLATLVQHSALSAPRLSRILRMDLSDVRTELSHLRRQGYVEVVAGTATYHLSALAGALVTRELRQANLI